MFCISLQIVLGHMHNGKSHTLGKGKRVVVICEYIYFRADISQLSVETLITIEVFSWLQHKERTAGS